MMEYFSKYQIQERQPKVAMSTLRSLQCPVLQSSALRGEPEASCGGPELFDWLGAVFCDVDLWVSGALAGCVVPAGFFNTSHVIMS